MRGAHSCGALMALVHSGLTHFDVVTAASAGACTAAYLVSGQFHLFPVIWTKYLHDGRFINLKKLATRHSVMDLDYLIHTVFREQQPLDVEAIRKSRTRFFIVATDCETGLPKYFDSRRDPIWTALKASAALPIAYRHPVVIDRKTYIDGGVSDPVPLQKAIDEGCDEIYLILTRPEGYRKKPPFFHILPRLYQKKYPKLAELFQTRYRDYNQLMERIENWGVAPRSAERHIRLTVIRPQGKLPLNRLTTNRMKILGAVEQGFREAISILTPNKSGSTIDFKAMLP